MNTDVFVFQQTNGAIHFSFPSTSLSQDNLVWQYCYSFYRQFIRKVSGLSVSELDKEKLTTGIFKLNTHTVKRIQNGERRKKKMNTNGSQISRAESKSPIIELQYFTISKEKKIKSQQYSMWLYKSLFLKLWLRKYQK